MNLKSYQNFDNPKVATTGETPIGIGGYYGATGFLPKVIKNHTPSNADNHNGDAAFTSPFPTIMWVGIVILLATWRILYEIS